MECQSTFVDNKWIFYEKQSRKICFKIWVVFVNGEKYLGCWDLLEVTVAAGYTDIGGIRFSLTALDTAEVLFLTPSLL